METMQDLLDLNEAQDLRLVEALRGGDRGALGEFLERNGRWVRGTVYAVLGDLDLLEDVVQEVWLTVWRRASRLEDARRWRGWLHRLAKNAAIDALRRKRSRLGLLERWRLWGRRPSSVPSEHERLELTDEHRRVLEAIEELPEIYREAFVLRHLESWDYRRMAEVLSLPLAPVETRLVRARRLLRRRLRGEDVELK